MYKDKIIELCIFHIDDKDKIIDELQTEAIEQIKDNKKLQDKLQEVNNDYNNDHKVHNDYADGLLEEIKTLQNKIEGLKSSDDVRKLRICRLKNDKLKADNVTYINDNAKLIAENDRLMEQVSSNRGNSSSTHTHTISKEIAEYMDHNEGCGGARLFLIPRDEFKNGEYDNTIYWDDGIE